MNSKKLKLRNMTKRTVKKKEAAPDARGMRGIRSRVKLTGRLRKKRGDTKIGTLEKIYHRKSLKKLIK
ncbi:MAG: hypothetical protein A3C12_00440 [Candidatus Sungbacteria bacterium RIFCSPHIGHO2_02_FULL_49_20]|uniref:Uncharacterized protein n=1 Tax=Candidatus Sungbacteria bacterium RIFCSPHIGHO2_02_FULL_49_20 TaxID=1802272 RepID=A0A1G2KPQ3_9BACT|nr:MAG: hypothetical protein A3C12_00440 [Candidatus Sungbacteria bacterium RIFCSPHIGHO2_02_FULL_49_20]